MNKHITITLNNKEKDRLSRLALRYGLSLQEFGRKILLQLQESFPQESFEDYQNPKALKASLTWALVDWKNANIQSHL